MEAIAAASDQGLPMPCAAQLPYSLVRRDWVESAEMSAALEASGAGLVASFVMAGGVLTGKYDAGGAGPRVGELDDPGSPPRASAGRRLRAVADEAGREPRGAGDRLRARQPGRRHRAVRRHLAGADRRERRRARDRPGDGPTPRGRASHRSIRKRAIDTGGGSRSSGSRSRPAPRTSSSENQPTSSSSPSRALGSPPSDCASKPSISEDGNGHGCELTYTGSRATMPDSSRTSRTTASSADSPGDDEPGEHRVRARPASRRAGPAAAGRRARRS